MSLEEGARVVIETCMNVTQRDRLVIVCDEDSYDIGMALRDAGRERTMHVRLFKLEIYGSRPLTVFPEAIRKAAREATVSLWTARACEGELETIRWPFIKTALTGGRHGHLVNVTPEVFKTGMTADYAHVKEFTDMLSDKLRKTERARVTNAQGTDFEVKFKDSWKWVASAGINHETGRWINLPDGEVYTAPESIEGKAVVDGVLGDHLGMKYHHRDLQETPLTVELKTYDKPTVVSVSSENQDMARDVEKYINKHECSKWVGEFSMGTNLYLKKLMDNMLQDEKFPGVHISVGNPMPEKTGATWTCPEKMAMILTSCNVWLDDEKVMEEGKYIIDTD